MNVCDAFFLYIPYITIFMYIFYTHTYTHIYMRF